MDQDLEYRQQQIQDYKRILLPLLRYLPWLEEKSGTEVSTLFRGEGLEEHSVVFPVYDATLMNFVREASKSELMDRNYLYVYSRRGIRSHDDERRLIQKADIRDWDMLRGIFSKYVLGGRTKAILWSEAVSERLFYLVMKQMKEIVEYWDKPIDVR